MWLISCSKNKGKTTQVGLSGPDTNDPLGEKIKQLHSQMHPQVGEWVSRVFPHWPTRAPAPSSRDLKVALGTFSTPVGDQRAGPAVTLGFLLMLPPLELSRGHTPCRGMWEWSLSVLSEEPEGNSKVSPSSSSLCHTRFQFPYQECKVE